ncbi:hypothetical protein CFP56_021861 [Quercus suber]|uniref:Uncharacterized protein n=1 Tax=Quercus suber TaxID=58331 RepID=A0AAW0KEK0_QUESU
MAKQKDITYNCGENQQGKRKKRGSCCSTEGKHIKEFLLRIVRHGFIFSNPNIFSGIPFQSSKLKKQLLPSRKEFTNSIPLLNNSLCRLIGSGSNTNILTVSRAFISYGYLGS